MLSTKRKASGELGSPPPKRHQATSLSTPRCLVRSPTPPKTSPASSRTLSAGPLPPGSSNGCLLTPLSLSVSGLLADYGADEEIDELLCRIRDGIEYESAQRKNGVSIKQSTRFEVSTTASPELALLRRYATLIWASSTHEVYELGISRPDWVAEGILPGIHDPQWWVDKSLAEIRAGPHGEETDIKRATAILKGLETKRGKKKVPTAREKEIDWKLREGFRRQEKGLRMSEDDSNGEDSESDDSKSDKPWGSELDNNESDDSEDQMPVRRGVRKVVPQARKRCAQLLESENEDEMPTKRIVRRMAARKPRKRARPVIEDSETETESEEDVPMLKDPRYLQFKVEQNLRR